MIVDQDDDLKNADTFEDDALNDDTFGSSAETGDGTALPNFFQHHGTTVLEELGHLDQDDAEDDILYEAEAFGTGLSDFFKPEYGNVSNTVYDSWMGAATGEDALEMQQQEEEDALEKELELAQRELQQFSLDPILMEGPYQSSSVTISLAASASHEQSLPGSGSMMNSTGSDTGRHLSSKEVNSLLSGKGIGKKVPTPKAETHAPPRAANIAPPLFPSGPATAASLPVGGAAPRAPTLGGPWNKPLPDFSDEPFQPVRHPPRGQLEGRGGRGRGGREGGRGQGNNKPDIGGGYQPQRYGGRGGPPPPRGHNAFHGPPPFAPGAFPGGPPPFPPRAFPGGPPPFPPGAFPGGPPPFPGGPPPMVPYGGVFPFHPPPLPHGQKMSSGEVRFVLAKVMDPLKMQDPYCDDFYSIQLAIKKNNERAALAAKNNTIDPTPPLHVPLPIWKVTKERLLQQMAASKEEQNERTAVWTKKEKVLGHVTRLDPSHPRQQMAVQTDTDTADDDSTANGEARKATYGTVLWNMRAAVNRGFNALYTVQELYQLLNTPMIVSNPEARADILNEVASALSLLSRSVGILPHVAPASADSLEELAAGGSTTPAMSSSDVVLEGGLVAALLQTIKGKKLITRSMRHLTTTQRWALTPVILARTLQTVNTKGEDGKVTEEETVEQRLMRVLVQFVQSESHLSDESMDLDRIEFSVNLLKNLRQCVRTVMVAQMEKSRLREALLSSRYRAEVMHNIIQVGDKIAKTLTEKNDTAVQWSEIREAFMSMLDN